MMFGFPSETVFAFAGIRTHGEEGCPSARDSMSCPISVGRSSGVVTSALAQAAESNRALKEIIQDSPEKASGVAVSVEALTRSFSGCPCNPSKSKAAKV
jgi:hypothetical protein